MITIPAHIFRGYDIRGLAESDLTDEVVERIAKGYTTWLLRREIYDCVVGRDCRISSPRIKDVVVRSLTDSGITVYDIGMTLTQIAYFAQYLFRTRGLIMITASHNPKEYNGMKLGSGFSETMVTEEIFALRDLVCGGKYEAREPKGKHIQRDVFPEYEEDLFRHVPESAIAPKRVVVDSCSATTGPFLPKILRRAGCEVIEQNTVPDGAFPVGTPDPTEKEVQERLATRVSAEKADLGFSYDADGDRMGVVDERGNLIWNDNLVSIFGIDILSRLLGAKIIYNTLCSKQVDEVIRAHGGVPIMWKTGHSFIKAKAQEEKAAFGGELSGHFFFFDNFYGHDDGAMATLRLLSYLSKVKKSLSAVVSALPRFVSSPEIKLACPDEIKFQLAGERVKENLKKIYPNARYIEIDGVRMDTESSMAIIRASHNGPYITIKFESTTREGYDALKRQVADILKKYKEIDFASGVNTSAFD